MGEENFKEEGYAWSKILLGVTIAFASGILMSIVFPADASRQFDLSATRTKKPKTILMPLPLSGFDPTETAVAWKIMRGLGHNVVIATPDGAPSGGADPYTLTGLLGGLVSKIQDEPLRFYRQMLRSREYQKPIAFEDIKPNAFDGLILVGGHDPNMRSYLDSRVLQDKVAQFWKLKRPVGAICHGVLVLARTKNAITQMSLIHNRKVTTVPAYMESMANWISSYLSGLPSFDYQLSTTWPRYTEEEVADNMRNIGQGLLDTGSTDLLAPLFPGTLTSHKHTHLVEDGQLVSARFWGDAYAFSLRFARKLNEMELHGHGSRIAHHSARNEQTALSPADIEALLRDDDELMDVPTDSSTGVDDQETTRERLARRMAELELPERRPSSRSAARGSQRETLWTTEPKPGQHLAEPEPVVTAPAAPEPQTPDTVSRLAKRLSGVPVTATNSDVGHRVARPLPDVQEVREVSEDQEREEQTARSRLARRVGASGESEPEIDVTVAEEAATVNTQQDVEAEERTEEANTPAGDEPSAAQSAPAAADALSARGRLGRKVGVAPQPRDPTDTFIVGDAEEGSKASDSEGVESSSTPQTVQTPKTTRERLNRRISTPDSAKEDPASSPQQLKHTTDLNPEESTSDNEEGEDESDAPRTRYYTDAPPEEWNEEPPTETAKRTTRGARRADDAATAAPQQPYLQRRPTVSKPRDQQAPEGRKRRPPKRDRGAEPKQFAQQHPTPKATAKAHRATAGGDTAKPVKDEGQNRLKKAKKEVAEKRRQQQQQQQQQQQESNPPSKSSESTEPATPRKRRQRRQNPSDKTQGKRGAQPGFASKQAANAPRAGRRGRHGEL